MIKDSDIDNEINHIEHLRSLYKSFLGDFVNKHECIELYHQWYNASLVLFCRYFPPDNKYLQKFQNVDNSHNGYGLRGNYNAIQASYHVLLNQIKNGGIVSIENKAKPPLLFISHSSVDENFVAALVNLLQTLGFNKSNLFCSSIEGYGIDEGFDIYDTLRKKFQEYDIYVVFVLSTHYYSSPACLNEMGAAWVLQSNYSTIVTSGFSVPEIKGAINPNKMAIVIDDKKHIRSTLNSFKDKIIKLFNLAYIDDDIVWENNRNKFIESVQN